MRPEQKSQLLLGVTRSKAKMLEYGVPEEHHIKITQDPAKLFTISIGLLGDLAAAINREEPDPDSLSVLRTNLLFSKAVGNIRSLVISSAAPGEGKSFTAANLTITLAQQKSKTLLIDADLRRGVLHNTFNCNKKPGLTNYLTGVASLEEVLQETYIPNLTLIACGSMIPNPSELLGSERMKRFVAGITKRFDMIVFDSLTMIFDH